MRNSFYFSTVGGKKNEHCDKMYKLWMNWVKEFCNAEFVLKDVDQEEKEGIHCDCSENLPVGFWDTQFDWGYKEITDIWGLS